MNPTNKQWWPMKFPVKRVSAVIILLIDAAAIYAMLKLGSKHNNTKLTELGYDTIKLSIQLILIVLVGGVFIQEYNRRNARKSAINDFRKDILARVSRAYSDTKGIRRILRANCVPMSGTDAVLAEDHIAVAIYDKHIPTIISTELELEMIDKELRIIKGAFDKTTELCRNISGMKEYLKKVFQEYEMKRKKYRESDLIPLSVLVDLKPFIAKRGTGESNFEIFAEFYVNTLTIIEEERIKL